MVERIEFGSLEAARQARGKVRQFLARSDDGRQATVILADNTPDGIVDRVEQEALQSREATRESYGRTELTQQERQNLERTTNFSWQQHGFQAMAAKAALEAQGATEWLDYYTPGESVDSSLAKLREAKQRGQQSRASIGIGGQRTDEEETGQMGRRARQAERVQSQGVDRAKEPAILQQDTEAIGFLREEQQFGGDVFDIGFGESDEFGRPVATGRDAELVEERHENRSERAQDLDEQKQAPITRDPVKWAMSPGEYDFPGVDTLDPRKKHAARSERAKDVDEQELAPLADSVGQWAGNMDEFDLPGVDTPRGVDLPDF